MPLSAADTKAPSIGALNAVGSVQLRGVSVSEGTVFSGDRLSVAQGGYARVAVATGQKIEVGSSSDVQVTREGNNLRVLMTTGNVSFTGNGQKVTIQLGNYEMTADGTASGQVAFVGAGTFGVRMMNGNMNVRNSQTKQSFVVTKGTERLVSLATGEQSATMQQLASAAPAAVPALPAARRREMSNGMVGGLLAAAAGGAALITYFAVREDGDAQAAKQKALTNLSAISQNAIEVSSAAAAVSSTASAAQTAINAATNITAAQKTTLTAAVTAITAKASGSATKIKTLSSQITDLNNIIAGQDEPTDAQQAQLQSLLNQLKIARDEANQAILDLNSLLVQAGGLGVGGLPNNNQGQVGGPTITSASAPF